MQTVISFGATVLSAMLGRRAASVGTVGRATTTMRGAGRAMKEARDVERAQQSVEAVEEQRQQLEDEFLSESRAIEAIGVGTEPLESMALRPSRAGVQVKVVALVWLPPSAGSR
jgi:hypothetical protein